MASYSSMACLQPGGCRPLTLGARPTVLRLQVDPGSAGILDVGSSQLLCITKRRQRLQAELGPVAAASVLVCASPFSRTQQTAAVAAAAAGHKDVHVTVSCQSPSSWTFFVHIH